MKISNTTTQQSILNTAISITKSRDERRLLCNLDYALSSIDTDKWNSLGKEQRKVYLRQILQFQRGVTT